MPYVSDPHEPRSIVDFVYHTIRAHTQAIKLLVPFKLTNALRTWILGKSINSLSNSSFEGRMKCTEFSSR